MAIYRTVSMTFWTDPKVTDDFTPEDRYFYLYLFTNPHTNLCGCYEISLKQMSTETGYSKDSIENLLKRFDKVHDVIRYSTETKEILLLNWHKYNWTESAKFRKPLAKEIQSIKEDLFREYLQKMFDGENCGYGIDTTYIDTNCIDTTVTVTDTVLNNNIVSNYPSVDNDNLSNNFSFNAEKAWNDTFAIYPKKDGFATAKQIWMDKILGVVPENQYDVAVLIAKAVKAYLSDYELKHPNLENYKYARRFDKWLTEDCDYWISQVEKGERE